MATVSSGRSKPPNFLIFMTDQQRADHLGCFGNPLVRTPHIDALADDGAVFERFYVNAPVCMPNRAALATGRMPSAAGVRMNGVPLPLSALTYADALREAGYRTALIGKAHFQNMTDARPSPVAGEPQIPRARQADADRRDGPGYDCELQAQWQRPDFRLSGPYYGFEDAALCLEHGDAVGGEYERWLQARSPEANERRLQGADGALEAGDAVHAPQAWRTALDEGLYPTNFITERSIEWLGQHARGADRERPFLLQCSFPDPHHPFTPPGRYWSMYAPEDVQLPPSFDAPLECAPAHKRALHEELAQGRRRTSGSRAIAVSGDEARQAIALNYGAISMVDDAIGRILQTLRDLGLDDDTVVIFLSDHGDFMGDHGLLFKGPLHYQSVVRTPLIWRDTATHRGAQRLRAPTCAMDLAPTLLARAGVQPLHGMQGTSLLERLHGAPETAREKDRAILVEEQSHRDVPGLPSPPRVRTLITERWRLSIFAGADWGELYDLQEDPDEIHNRFDDPPYQTIRGELLWRLGREMTGLSSNLPLATHMA